MEPFSSYRPKPLKSEEVQNHRPDPNKQNESNSKKNIAEYL